MTRHHSHSHTHKSKCARSPVVDIPPWSETREEPDAQWVPVIPCITPLKVIRTPFYTSSEDPAPEWATNVVIKPAVTTKHRHTAWGVSPFLRTHWKDNIPRYVYGTNPFSDTVNSGGSHYQ